MKQKKRKTFFHWHLPTCWAHSKSWTWLHRHSQLVWWCHRAADSCSPGKWHPAYSTKARCHRAGFFISLYVLAGGDHTESMQMRAQRTSRRRTCWYSPRGKQASTSPRKAVWQMLSHMGAKASSRELLSMTMPHVPQRCPPRWSTHQRPAQCRVLAV